MSLRRLAWSWLAITLGWALAGARSGGIAEAQVWISTADGRLGLAEQPTLAWRPLQEGRSDDVRIEVRPETAHQRILGFGASLEPATCWNLSQMPPAGRRQTLRRLLHPVEGIGMNLMRLCIGTPDFTGDPWYTYNDLPAGETDPELARFSIEKDRRYILPILREALEVHPALRFFASPWSPPGWMKTTESIIGGELKREWYGAYAEYFAKFIEAYAAEGIPIHAVTVQNEPGVDRAKENDPDWFYPSCHWTAEQERDFIRDHLGPTFARRGLPTEIWCYDHNYNVQPSGDDPGIAYPRAILSDAAAAQFVDGVAFHGYAGRPSGMSVFHGEFPEMPIYFTETSVYGVRGAAQIAEFLRHWAGSYNAWVTMLDENLKPNNGPFEADPTCVSYDTRTREATYGFDYFMYGHYMKFIQRDARRVDSTSIEEALPNVALRNPDGRLVLVVVNPGRRTRSLAVVAAGRVAELVLPSESVATLVWAAP